MSQTLRYDRNTDGTLGIKLFNVEDGKENVLVNTLILDCKKESAENQTKAMVYGFSKIFAERTSDIVPSQDKLDEIQEIYDALVDGPWERERKKGGGPTVRIEVEALAGLRGITVKQAQTLLKKYDKDAQEKIFTNPKVVAAVAKLQAKVEKTSDDISFDDLVPDEPTEGEPKSEAAA